MSAIPEYITFNGSYKVPASHMCGKDNLIQVPSPEGEYKKAIIHVLGITKYNNTEFFKKNRKTTTAGGQTINAKKKKRKEKKAKKTRR